MTAVVLFGPVRPSTLNPMLIRTQTQPLAISAQLLEPQPNNRLSGQLVPDAQRHFLCIGGSMLLAQDLRANAQRILPAGCSQSKPGECTSIGIELAQQQNQSSMQEIQSMTTLPLP
ncbi:hypothetical protein DPMN_019682 [Dreissena polymorpha]|uniref:Uncharacterized protein n=1 Tax=Dreissena polymorpha TaxID=45954 RepID=A0A9D4SAF1_DREPO|nr:hypothetical protein DPMN_019682 [Dreissena polymorpha]